MNSLCYDVLLALAGNPRCSQRQLAEITGFSLGTVNKSLQELRERGYVNDDMTLSHQADRELEEKSPRQAVILAAGYGFRMYPIHTNIPKAFLQVHGEYLIERMIRQLHEAGVFRIYVVVGFMKESFEYLIDEFGVELIVNPQYDRTGSMYSLHLAEEHLENAYIIPSDVWCRSNPFRSREAYSWYMVSSDEDPQSEVRMNRKHELVKVVPGETGQHMIGISYITADAHRGLKAVLARGGESHLIDMFWETALYQKDRMIVKARMLAEKDVAEINTYVQLCHADKSSPSLISDTIAKLMQAVAIRPQDMSDITPAKQGNTNTSFSVVAKGKKYFATIPKEKTAVVVNHQQEWAVYEAIRGQGLCDDPVYVDPDTGVRIFHYIDGIRHCNPENQRDVERCMDLLRKFHHKGLKVEHSFDLFQKIQENEDLWEGKISAYRDYAEVKKRVFGLRPYIEQHAAPAVLTHNDPVADNFIFRPGKNGQEELQLIDWEFGAMQDPHVDIAMFAVFAMYDRSQVEKLIDIYFDGQCPSATRNKIYCYISACGLLWSNWCENLRIQGENMGEYSLKQYRFAKVYSRIAEEAIEKEGITLR